MYRVFDEYKTGSLRNLAPCSLNYKNSLASNLRKVSKMTKGRVVKVDYFNAANELVLSVDIAYTEGAQNTTYPLVRTTTRCWFDIVGINHNILNFDKTVKTKQYDVYQTAKEGQIRRHNIIESMFAMTSELGYETEAIARMQDQSVFIRSYESMGDTTLITNLVNDTTSAWLNNPYPLDSTLTLRQVMIGGLTV